MRSQHFDEGPFDMTLIDFYGRQTNILAPFTAGEWRRTEGGREWVVSVDDAEGYRIADAIMPKHTSRADRANAQQWLLDMLAVYGGEV